VTVNIDCYVCGAATLHVHRETGRSYCRDHSVDSVREIPLTYSADVDGTRVVRMTARLVA
jgi:hypothetical protein